MNSIKRFSRNTENTEYNPYDTNLPEVFNQIKDIIHDVLPDVRIEHVGSSSIPGIGGRNVIDIIIPAIDSEHDAIKSKLYLIGFMDSPWEHFIPVQVGMINYKGKDYPILLYVMPPETQHFKGLLMYRDYMRTHPEDAKQYDRVKQEVIASGSIKSDDYQAGKTPFILSMIEKIKQSKN
jgi:GrpB-like predicted nucleotidyltransferase (UPF0157 family)